MQIVIEFLKKNWLLIALIIGVAIYIHMRLSNAEEVLKLTVESQNNQMAEVQKYHKKEIEERDKALQEYQSKVKSLEDDYNKKSADLLAEKRKKIQIIVKYYDNPEKLISKIQEMYGFRYVPNK